MSSNTTPSQSKAADIVLGLLVEVGGLVIITVVAGISDKAANIMLLLMVGVWALWLVTNSAQVTELGNMFSRIEANAK